MYSFVTVFRAELERAVRERRARTSHPMGWTAAVVLVLVAGWTLLSIARGTDEIPEKQFLEDGSMTIAAALLLAMASALSWAVFLLAEGRGRWFWCIAGAGFLFLALDEQLEFHETIGDLLDVSAVGPSMIFRNWNDLIVIGYGAVALGLTVAFLPEILRYPMHAEFLAIGFSFYVAHTAVDMLVPGVGSIKTMFEETPKLFADAFFFLGMLAALRAVSRPSAMSIGR